MPKISKAALNYEAWKQKQAIIGQLNQLKQRGFTDDDIRAAGPNAWQTLQGKTPRTQTGFNPTGMPPQTQYTIRDGDNLNTIASQFGMDAKSLLDANPDMTSPKTGMVINVKPPPVYSQAQLQNMAQQPNQYFLGFDVTRANITPTPTIPAAPTTQTNNVPALFDPNMQWTNSPGQVRDMFLQSYGMPTVGPMNPGLQPTIWGSPDPNAPGWQKALRTLGYFPAIGIGAEFGARLINKVSGNRFSNKWWKP